MCRSCGATPGTGWKKYHHPVYSFAYLFAPEYHFAQPWTNHDVKTDVEKMLKRYLPDTAERSPARLAMDQYIECEGVSAKADVKVVVEKGARKRRENMSRF